MLPGITFVQYYQRSIKSLLLLHESFSTFDENIISNF